MITLRFACGHAKDVDETINIQPVCPICGEPRIQNVQAPAPRFSGFCSGPSATMTHVEPHSAPLKGTNG